jgi:sporulation integral membrane protein YtvI
MNHDYPYRFLRALWVAALLALAALAIYFGLPLLYPFLIGFLLALVMRPIAGFLHRRMKMPRWLAVTVSIVLIVGVLGGLLTLIIIRIIAETNRLVQFINLNYEKWFAKFSAVFPPDGLRSFFERIGKLYADSGMQETVDRSMTSIGESVARFISGLLESLGQGLLAIVSAVPNLALGLLVALVAAFFICKDWEKIAAWLADKMPARVARTMQAVWVDLHRALFGFVRAQLILISITTMLVIIGLFLLRVPYALTVGLLIGLVDLLPYLGTSVVFIPWIIYVFIEGNITFGIGLAVLYAIVMIARHLSEPKVYSSSLGLYPLVTLISLFVGLKLFGFIGLLVGPTLVIIGLSLHRAGVLRDIRNYVRYGSIEGEAAGRKDG